MPMERAVRTLTNVLFRLIHVFWELNVAKIHPVVTGVSVSMDTKRQDPLDTATVSRSLCRTYR